MQTWIFIIGFLVLAGIGLDMLRRTRNAGRDAQEMDLHMQRGLMDDEGDTDESLENNQNINERNKQEPSVNMAKSTGRGMHSVVLNDTQKSLEDTQKVLEDTQKVRRTPTVPNVTQPINTDDESDQIVPMLMDAGSDEAHFSEVDEDDPLMGGSTPILSRPRIVQRQLKPGAEPAHQEVIVINVMAQQGEGLVGSVLLESVISSGLRYGEMNIFHYHLSHDDDTILFSMANMVKPGTFDLNSMTSFQTPGVSFFMSLPFVLKKKSSKEVADISAMETFEKMLACAQKVANNLQGDLRDERRNVMTGQTIEHCRQRISEFSRLTLSRSGRFIKS